MNIDTFHLIIFFGAGLSLLMGISQLLNRPVKRENLLLSIFFFSLSLFQFQQFVIDGWLGREISLGGQPIGFDVYLIGPSLYLYFQLLLDSTYRFRAGRLFHFLPAFLSILVKGTVQILEVNQSWFVNTLWGDFLFYIVPVLTALAGLLLVLTYFLLILFKLRLVLIVRSKEKDRFLSNLVIITVCSGILILLLAALSLITGNYFLYKTGISLLSLHVIFWFLLEQKYPEFTSRVVKEVKTERYRRSLISGIDTDHLMLRLNDLMEEEKLFRDEELSLDTLAHHLSITSHQLSEFLNNNIQVNFKTFVNRYRIQEAKEMLIREPERSILSVAYNTGFNTKSTFYNAFSKLEGITPMEYRRLNLFKK